MDVALSNHGIAKSPTELSRALLIVIDLVTVTGPDNGAGFVAHQSGSIRNQPSELREGAETAMKRGLPFAPDLHTTTPEITDFHGPVGGLDVRVCRAMRRLAP